MTKAEIKLRKLMYIVSAYYLGNKINREQKKLIDKKMKVFFEMLSSDVFLKVSWAIQDELKQNLVQTSHETIYNEFVNGTVIAKFDFDKLMARANKSIEKLNKEMEKI